MEIFNSLSIIVTYAFCSYFYIVHYFGDLGKFKVWMNDGSHTIMVFLCVGTGFFIWAALYFLLLTLGEKAASCVFGKE